MSATSTPISLDLPKQIVEMLLNTIDESTKNAYHMFWDFFMSILIDHWLTVIIVLVLALIIAWVVALSGRWGMFGTVLYHYLYFGILFLLGLIKGPEVFVSEYFEILCLVILYPICYFVTGSILDKTGVKRRF
jgi:hypothetical protein